VAKITLSYCAREGVWVGVRRSICVNKSVHICLNVCENYSSFNKIIALIETFPQNVIFLTYILLKLIYNIAVLAIFLKTLLKNVKRVYILHWYKDQSP
jgi:predicted ferric reductase